ncbi:hypothetical protein Nepgr_015212 [Nepenthes gracilis]|uniref:Protein SCAR n=1 Tax=Nepenthes gracilis TaxID=150966 RepID=A0AAD3SMT8_NEPGR|nr:hypothetical protein Nepgr_015212 [Nepenthes gracilis]
MSRDTYQRRESQSAIVSHSITLSDAIPHARDHILVSAEGHPVDVMACENSEISSIALQDLPNRSDASEDNRSTGSINKVLETEPANNGSLPSMADGMMSSSLSVRSHGNKLNFNLGLREVETCSDVVSALKNPPVSASDHLEIMKPARFAAEENHCIPSTEENSEKLPLFLQPAQSCSLVELHPSEITDAGLLPPHYLPEEAVRVDGYEHSNREISTATETEVMMTSMLSNKQSKIMSDASEENLSSGSFNGVLQTGTANDVCLPTNSVGSPGNKCTHDLGWPEIEACLDNASLQKNAPISSSSCPEITKPVELAVEENHCIPPTRENSENPPLFLDPAQSGCPVGQHPSEIIDVDLLAQHYFPEEAAPVDVNEQSNNSNISTATEMKEMMTSMLSVDQSKIMSDASEENLSSGSFDEVLQTGPTNDGCLPNLVCGMICSPDSVGLHGDRWTHDLSWPEVEACLDVGSLLNNAPVSTCSCAEITKPADVAVEENHCIPSTEENLENLPLFLDPAQSCSPVEQNPFETIDAGLSPLHYLPDGVASANGYEVSNKGIPAAIENVEMIAYMSQVVQSETTTDSSEENCSSRTFNEVLQTGRGNDGLLPNLVDGMMGSPHSFSSPGDKRIHDLGWPAVDACLDVASLLDNASVSASCPEIVKPADLAVEEDHCIPSTEENSANLCHSSDPEQSCSLVVKNPSIASLSPLHYLPEDAASANGDEVSNRGIPTAIENEEMIASMLPADPSETMSDAYEDNHDAGSFNEVLRTVSANDGSLRDLADGIMGTICSVSSGHLCTCDSNQQEVETCLDDASPLFSSPVSTSSSPGVTKLAGLAPEGGHILSTEEHSEGLLLLEPAQSCRPLDMHTSEITDIDFSPHLNLPEKAAPVCRYELGEKILENELMAASVSSVKQSEIPDPVSGPLQTHINLLADEIHAGPTDPSCSEIYMLSMLPNASEINPEEMPPLPPLPPMQWRLGKLQHACLPKESPMMEHAHGPVKLIPAPAVDCNEEIFPLASMAEKAKSVNPLLSLSKIEDENFPNISVYSRGYMVPGTFTQPMISMEQQNALNVDRQLDNPLYSTHVTCVRSTNGLPTPEMEPNQPNSNLLEPGLTIKNLLLGPVAASVNGKEIQPKAAIIDDQLQHFPSVTLQESMKPSGQFMLVPTMIYEQKPPQGFMAPEEVTTWLSNTSNTIRASEDGNANGTLQKKIPRPRNPLIDEVVALDKSKLRKVGERVQVLEKAEERDTLLEQIRNKSVNLKPAATTRPSIQGPKTNLKVAAILEKANTIRQAMAGSDEDDSDSWSDS